MPALKIIKLNKKLMYFKKARQKISKKILFLPERRFDNITAEIMQSWPYVYQFFWCRNVYKTFRKRNVKRINVLKLRDLFFYNFCRIS